MTSDAAELSDVRYLYKYFLNFSNVFYALGHYCSVEFDVCGFLSCSSSHLTVVSAWCSSLSSCTGIMPKTCAVAGCHTGHKRKKNEPENVNAENVFDFPDEEKDQELRSIWVNRRDGMLEFAVSISNTMI